MKTAVESFLNIFPDADVTNRDALYPISFNEFEQAIESSRTEPLVMPNEVLTGVRKCKTCKFIKDCKMCALFYSENGFMQYCSGYESQREA